MEETQIKELETRVFNLPDRASLITVHNEPTLIRANEFLRSIMSLKKDVDDTFDPISKKQYEAFKETKEQKKKFEQPLTEAELIVKKEIRKYMSELERQRQEAEAKRREEEEKRFQAARDAEKIGLDDKAKEIREEETALAPVPEKPKLQGTFIRKDWTWKLIDIDQVPREYLTVDVLKINRIVKQKKDKANIPGIKVYQEPTVVSRTKF